MATTPGLRVWLAALLPLLPVVLALAVLPVPHDDKVKHLDGDWRIIDGDVIGAQSASFNDGGWSSFHVPGQYGFDHKISHGWARRHFSLDEPVHGDQFLMVPNIGGFARVFMNGRLIGEKGVPETGKSLDQERLDGFSVPRSLLKIGDNVLALELVNPNPNDGIPDPRFLLGAPEIVTTYLERATSMKRFLEYGALMLNIFGIALVAYLFMRGPEDRALYRSSLMVMTVVSLYLMGKTGLPLAYFVDAYAVGRFVQFTILGIALATPELIESYYVGRTTWFRKLNRVLCALWFLAAVVVGVDRAYKPLSPWLFVVIVHALVFVVRDLIRPRTEYGPVLASAIAVTAATGAADLFCDLNLVYLPRLFSYGVANLGVIATVLAFADFVRLGRRLEEKNIALADALKRAEETSRLKSEFLANTSHELRTPLNAIINLPQGLLAQIVEKNVVVCSSCSAMFEPDDASAFDADTLCPSCSATTLSIEAHRFPPDDADALAAHLRSIIGSGEHLLAVVNDILDYSKLAAGKMQLSLARVDVAEVVARALDTVSPGARSASVTLQANVAKGIAVDADPTRLVQILINLAQNAVKFSSAGGAVEVNARVDGESVRIDVVDKGIGIDPEHHATIFESFRQIEGGHTRKHGGTGLGLAIVKQMVEMHGGTIVVDSALGRGATFTVRLKRASTSA